MLEFLSSAGNLALVVIAFGLIIVLHELGHFLAAKWAGVRVHTFAVGFGPPICSWRKGIGFRLGSTWPDVRKRLVAEEGAAPPGGEKAPVLPPGIGETEYRLAWVPLGGYVEMLGQEDLRPGATSEDPRSYASKHPWKRLVIISAGVVMNVIVAAALFIGVFMIGMRVPPPIVGATAPNTPAAEAAPVNAEQAGVSEAGLQPGDRVVRIGGWKANSFNDIFARTAIAERNAPVELLVNRPGVEQTLRFNIIPKRGEASGLLQLGFAVPLQTTLVEGPGGSASPEDREQAQCTLEQMGLAPLGWGGTITHVNDEPVSRLSEVRRAFQESKGAPVAIRGERADAESVSFEVRPDAALHVASVGVGEAQAVNVAHLLGLSPPMRITEVTEAAGPYGLQGGDVIARIGRREWPNPAEAIRLIRAAANSQITLLVLRDDELIALDARVGAEGRIGFNFEQARATNILTRPPQPAEPEPSAQGNAEGPRFDPAAGVERLDALPGSRIEAIDDRPVSTYTEIRGALKQATLDARAADGEWTSDEVSLRVRLPLATSEAPVEENLSWTLRAEEIESLHALGWEMPFSELFFQPEQVPLRAETPVEAMTMGLAETRRVMIMTYLTLARLFQGTVRVEHLNGPVGIAHIGTRVAEQGLIKLLFFMAVVSVNLAVLNFLPLPIVDGGHALFILWEWGTGKPVSVAVQNVATLLGLILIGAVFVVVTYHDVMELLS